MKRFVIVLELLLVLSFIVSINPNKIKASDLMNSYSLSSLMIDIDQERVTEKKKYNAYVVDKIIDGAFLTDGRDKYIFAYIDKNTNKFLINGERIVFEVEDAGKENGIYIANLINVSSSGSTYFFPDVEKIDLENIYTTSLKKIEINEIYINNGRSSIDNTIINVYDKFSDTPYQNGTHMHAVGYVLRKNDAEINFYIMTKYEKVESITINTKTLGVKGLAYGNGSSSINGIVFSYQEIGDYGFDIQMRSKQNSTNNTSSTIYNKDEFKTPIKSIRITYKKDKTPRNEKHVLCFYLGNTKECNDAIIYLNTNDAKKEYKTELRKDFKYIKIVVPDLYGYSSFIESFVLEFKQ